MGRTFLAAALAVLLTVVLGTIVLLVTLNEGRLGAPSLGAPPVRIQAQAAPDSTLATLLTTLSAQHITFTVQFVADVPRLGNSVSVQAGRTLARVGADYACFALPGEASTLMQCVPFANIAGVLYTEDARLNDATAADA